MSIVVKNYQNLKIAITKEAKKIIIRDKLAWEILAEKEYFFSREKSPLKFCKSMFKDISSEGILFAICKFALKEEYVLDYHNKKKTEVHFLRNF